MKIALDAMGGDYAPREIVLGAIQACREYDADIILVGDEKLLEKELAQNPTTGLKLMIEPASEVIAMDDHPTTAVKQKKDSSMVVANRLVKEGKAQAVISAGNTGAILTASLLTLGRIKGIKRPALPAPMPTAKGITILMDVGANAECDPINLLQFAQMGSIYAEQVLEIAKPRVGLLNIGQEETKGNKLSIEAFKLLQASQLNFAGNIEGRDFFNGDCQVVVCDGFVGNIVLKIAEGLAPFLLGELKQAISSSYISSIGGLMIKGSVKKLKALMDFTEYGGMPLLGLDGLSFKSHGASNAKAIKNAVKAALKAVRQDFVGKIDAAVNSGGKGE